MQGKDKTAEERRIAICIFDDVAEQCCEAALKYLILHSSLCFCEILFGTLNGCGFPFDEFFFYCKNRYYDTYLPFLLEASNDEDANVRQVCRAHPLHCI
jgi:importin-5